MKTIHIAALLAGGTGTRMGGNIPKQLLPLAGRLVIEHSIDAFDSNDGIDEVMVVSHPDYIETIRSIVERNHWRKTSQVVLGGKERYLSSLAAINACGKYDCEVHLLIHDAARPLVSQHIIDEVILALKKCEAVGVGVPATDTIWQIKKPLPTTKSNCLQMQSIPDRTMLYCAQTPQAFHLNTIRNAYQKALADPLLCTTDDCGVVMKYTPEIPIHIVMGSSANLKITYPEDIHRAEMLLQKKDL